MVPIMEHLYKKNKWYAYVIHWYTKYNKINPIDVSFFAFYQVKWLHICNISISKN